MIEKAQKEATYDLWQPPFVSVFSYTGRGYCTSSLV